MIRSDLTLINVLVVNDQKLLTFREFHKVDSSFGLLIFHLLNILLYFQLDAIFMFNELHIILLSFIDVDISIRELAISIP